MATLVEQLESMFLAGRLYSEDGELLPTAFNKPLPIQVWLPKAVENYATRTGNYYESMDWRDWIDENTQDMWTELPLRTQMQLCLVAGHAANAWDRMNDEIREACMGEDW